MTLIDRRQFRAGSLALPWASHAGPRPPRPGGFPARIIKVVMPYPAGGIVDVVTRAVVDPLSAEMPQRLVVEKTRRTRHCR